MRVDSIGASALLRGVAMACLLAIPLAGCRDRIAPGDVSTSIRAPEGALAATVEREVAPAFERASGTVASSHETTVSSKILARIDRVDVVAGSVVSQGELVIRLDDRDLRTQLAQRREAQRAAVARLELAQREEERVRRLFEAEVASEEQTDQARAALRVAQADVEAAAQQVADAEVSLSYAEIRAPVGGRVIDRLAEPGDMASPGVPLLRIYDPSALRLEAPVRESLAVRLDVGDTLGIYIDALEERLDGPIEEIVPFAHPGARTLLIKVRLPEDPRLFAGMYGRLEVPAGDRARLLVPESAVTRIGQLAFATALVEDDRLERRWLTLGAPLETGRVEVLSGLAAGERVIVSERP